jgi:hypothetical protein
LATGAIVTVIDQVQAIRRECRLSAGGDDLMQVRTVRSHHPKATVVDLERDPRPVR